MLEACWLWFVISKEYMELTRPKIESRDPIFFTGTRSRSRVSGNDRLFPRGSEFGPNPEIPASPLIQLRPRPVNRLVIFNGCGLASKFQLQVFLPTKAWFILYTTVADSHAARWQSPTVECAFILQLTTVACASGWLSSAVADCTM